MDATPATAAAADITSPKTAMLADGVMTTGTGSGGGGGLEYETGTYTPASDVAQPTISFTNTHSEPPLFAMMVDTSNTSPGSNSNIYWGIKYFSKITNSGIYYNSNSSSFANINAQYVSTSSVSNGNYIALSDSTIVSTWASITDIKPGSNSTSRYWRAGRTYKWIAVWKPST